MKILAALVITVVSNVAFSDDSKTTTYQTLPNSTVRDYRAPTYVTKG